MTNSQGVTFGMLTASARGVSYKELDVNHDGVVTQEEAASVFQQKSLDVLDLSTMDKDADQKVTEREYILWDQEQRMSDIMTRIKDGISRDFIGRNQDDMKDAIEQLDSYLKEFISEYSASGKDLNKMAQAFAKELPTKYDEIKNDIINNNTDAIRDRVVDSVIEFVEKDAKTVNSDYKQLMDKKTGELTDNSKRLFKGELETEADKFIKDYKGSNLEADLTEHLKLFLQQSDKSKLADAIQIWERGKEELANLPKEIALMEAKSKAKAFLLKAIKEGVTTIKLGDVMVRNELEVMAALAQYKDYTELVHDLNKSIGQLSTITRQQELEQQAALKEEGAPVQSVISSGDIFGNDFKLDNLFNQ